MNRIHSVFAAIAVMFAFVISGCGGDADTGDTRQNGGALTARGDEHDRDSEHSHGEGGEHDSDGHEHHGDEGEESGTELTLDDSYDETRHGARLLLTYDADSNSFNGTVENRPTSCWNASASKFTCQMAENSAQQLRPTSNPVRNGMYH